MPWSTRSAVRCSGKQVVCSALVALACLALASCGGGPGAVHPDLVVEDAAVSDDRPAAGASFTFSATVRNAGRGNAAATTLRVYRSDDETITPADEPVGAAAAAELAASESRVASVTVTAASSPGTSYYGACVDPVAGESDTANNCSATVRVTVPAQDTDPPPPRPDLVVETPAVSDDGPAAGDSFTFSATVRNAGDGDAAATTLRFYRSDDATVTTADQEVGAATVAELASLESMVASVELSAPSSSGTHYYGACVHPLAEESDTTNNCSAPVPVSVHAPQVRAPEPPRPDLIVNRLWVSAGEPAIGGLFKLETEAVNGGSAPAGPTAVRFYRSTDATVTRSDTELGTVWLPSLLGFDRIKVRKPVAAPSSETVLYYGACADTVAGESATTNNCSAALKVEVLHNIPDLYFGTWFVHGSLAIGKTTSVGVSVYNGGSPSEATTLRLILLPDRESAPSAGTQVVEVDVPELIVTGATAASTLMNVEFQAPATAGWYYYVTCVDAVTGESNTANNCSTGTAIEFR